MAVKFIFVFPLVLLTGALVYTISIPLWFISMGNISPFDSIDNRMKEIMEWISAKDELPEELRLVLVID